MRASLLDRLGLLLGPSWPVRALSGFWEKITRQQATPRDRPKKKSQFGFWAPQTAFDIQYEGLWRTRGQSTSRAQRRGGRCSCVPGPFRVCPLEDGGSQVQTMVRPRTVLGASRECPLADGASQVQNGASPDCSQSNSAHTPRAPRASWAPRGWRLRPNPAHSSHTSCPLASHRLSACSQDGSRDSQFSTPLTHSVPRGLPQALRWPPRRLKGAPLRQPDALRASWPPAALGVAHFVPHGPPEAVSCPSVGPEDHSREPKFGTPGAHRARWPPRGPQLAAKAAPRRLRDGLRWDQDDLKTPPGSPHRPAPSPPRSLPSPSPRPGGALLRSLRASGRAALPRSACTGGRARGTLASRRRGGDPGAGAQG